MPTDRHALPHKKVPDAWQTKVQEWLKLGFPCSWLFIASLVFGLGWAVLFVFEQDTDRVWLLGIWALLIATIANAVVLYEKIIDNIADDLPELLDEEDTKAAEWVCGWYQRIFWSKKILLFGICFGVFLALVGQQMIESVFSTFAGKAYGYFINFVTGFTGGSMFLTMVGIARMMSSLGKDVSIRPSIFDTKTSALRVVIAALWKVALVAVFVYALGISTLFLCPDKPPEIAIAVSGAFGVFVLAYFVYPQVNVHKTLSRLKRQKLEALIGQIENSFDKVTQEPTPANIAQLRDLFDLQHIVNSKKSWTFGSKELLILIGSVIIPLIVVLAKYLIYRL